jgi:hypothetical protein
MKKYHVNYADRMYYGSQRLNTDSGKTLCKFDVSLSFNKENLDNSFVQKNNHILNQPRGAGYWLWKPYCIVKALSQMNDNDLLFYTDSGSYFLTSIDPITQIMENTEEKLLLFTLEEFHTHEKWTKRDCFVLMDMDKEPYISCGQILASFVLMKKTKFVIDFMNEWLNYAQDYRLITDSPNECGKPNYANFIDHRHDQSILSLLGRKYNIKTIPDISQYGNDRRSAAIPQIMNHTRKKI